MRFCTSPPEDTQFDLGPRATDILLLAFVAEERVEAGERDEEGEREEDGERDAEGEREGEGVVRWALVEGGAGVRWVDRVWEAGLRLWWGVDGVRGREKVWEGVPGAAWRGVEGVREREEFVARGVEGVRGKPELTVVEGLGGVGEEFRSGTEFKGVEGVRGRGELEVREVEERGRVEAEGLGGAREGLEGFGGVGEELLLIEEAGGGLDDDFTAGAAETVRARVRVEEFEEGGERGEREELDERVGEGLEESLGEVVRALSTYLGPIFHFGSSSANFSQYRI